jgi:hypothetical protein
MAGADTETTTASLSAGHPPLTSLGKNVDASDISGDSIQKLPGHSPKNAEMEAITTETSATTPSAGHPPSTSVGANVNASEISGNSGDSTQTQKLTGQFPNNAKMAADTTGTSTATPPADLPPLTSVPPPLAASTTSETLFDSSQENPNVQ